MDKSNTQKINGFKVFFKKYGFSILMLAGLFATVFLIAMFRGKVDVGEVVDENNLVLVDENSVHVDDIVETSKSEQTSFVLPVDNVVVVRDYSEDEFVNYVSLGYYAIHKAIDFSSEKGSGVYSIASGKVLSIETTSNSGTKVVVEHDNGFKSVYSSLDSNLNVQVGQKIKSGQQIGNMSNSMLDEAELGVHLHFELLKDNKLVDPNLYIAISNK